MQSSGFSTWEEAIAWLLTQPDKQELVRDCYFDVPLRVAAERYWKSPEWVALRDWLPSSPGRALEIGAGRGIASFALARDGWTVDAVEPDPSSLVGAEAIRQLARTEDLAITVTQAEAETLPFADETFDLVFCRAVLHHARDLGMMCREASRVLKRGGKFVAIREHIVQNARELQSFLREHPLHCLYGGEHAFPVREYRRAIARAGFRMERMLRSFDSPINYAPYTRESLRVEIQGRLSPPRIGSALDRLLRHRLVLDVVLAILSRVDRRPGRLHSFVARKPK